MSVYNIAVRTPVIVDIKAPVTSSALSRVAAPGIAMYKRGLLSASLCPGSTGVARIP